MTGSRVTISPRRFRAPREHGRALVEPSLARAAQLLVENRRQRQSCGTELHGLRLTQLAATARHELVQRARDYTNTYQDVPVNATLSANEAPIFLSGHQPQLFHPGVWFKNFVLSSWGQAQGAIAINLIVDNDVARAASIRVPTGTTDEPRGITVPLDGSVEDLPFEERPIGDETLFKSFAHRVQQQLDPFIPNPLVGAWWPDVLDQARRERNLGRCLAASRHRLEHAWGLRTLELPLSQVCETSSFRWFTAHLLAELPRFREVYNEALAEYRHVYRLRSRSHPVPELTMDGEWHEAPFWIWTAASPRRRRVFARRAGSQLIVTDRAGAECRLSLTPDGQLSTAVEQLEAWSKSGVRLRSRALTTTLYARLVLSDMFLHGIGGAMYDQLTDVLFQQFFGCAPPAFLTLTATAHLPIAHPAMSEDEVQAATRMLRELWFHPERHLDEALRMWEQPLEPAREIETAHDAQRPTTDPRQLGDEKRRWLALELPRGARKPRHQAIGELNDALRAWMAPLRERWLMERRARERAARHHALLASREFSFCLFPADELRRTLLELSAVAL